VHEFERCGGPTLDRGELKRHLIVYAAMMGLTWLLDVPQTLSGISDLSEVTDRRDSRIASNERFRAQLLILTAFLNLWEKTDMGAVLADLASY